MSQELHAHLRTVVEDYLRSAGKDGDHLLPMVLRAGSVPGEDVHSFLSQGRRDVILCREWIAPCGPDRGAELFEDMAEVRRLCLQVYRNSDGRTSEDAVLFQPVAKLI